MPETNNSCPLCTRVAELSGNKDNPFLIREFPNSFFVVGEHQYYEGYSQLIFKDHQTELHELPAQTQSELFNELMIAGSAVAKAFQPRKMNYSCYGNVVPHIHWHLFPRYAAEPDYLQVPWYQAASFGNYATDVQMAQRIAARIKANLF